MRVKILEADKSQKIDDQALILRILNKLPEQYDGVREMIERDIDKAVWPSVSEVLEALVGRHACIQTRLNANSGGSGEKTTKADTALYAGGGFKGNCNNCGKRGHKAQDCRAAGGGAANGGRGGRGNGNGGRGGGAGRGSGAGCGSGSGQTNGSGGGQNHNSNVTCNYCKETGHMKYSCPKLAVKNGGDPPSGDSDKANVAKGTDPKEVSLVTVEKFTKLSACGRCNEIGFHGGRCLSCGTGMHTEPVSDEEAKEANIGQCWEATVPSVRTVA
jgi:Zinc knuckle